LNEAEAAVRKGYRLSFEENDVRCESWSALTLDAWVFLSTHSGDSTWDSFFRRSPEELGEPEIRQFLLHHILVQQRLAITVQKKTMPVPIIMAPKNRRSASKSNVAVVPSSNHRLPKGPGPVAA
jgi:hypothetical protein